MPRKKGPGPRRKPRGTTGSVQLGGGKPSAFVPIELPDTKEDIQDEILDGALRAGKEKDDPSLPWFYRHAGRPVTNEENNFDFTLEIDGGEEYLDLIEAAPLATSGGSYEKLPLAYSQGELADALFRAILRKVIKYGPAGYRTIHLLLYDTDQKLRLGQGILDLLAVALQRQPAQPFTSVVYYTMTSKGQGRLALIHPRPPEFFSTFDEAQARGIQVALVDMVGVRPEAENVAVMKLGAIAKLGPGQVAVQITHQAIAGRAVIHDVRLVASPPSPPE